MGASFTSLADLAIIIVAGSIGGFIAVRSKLPTIVGYILAGLFISVVISTIGSNYSFNSVFVTETAQLGVAFLLFAAGIEFSVNNIKKIRNLIIAGTLTQTVLVISFSTLIMQIFRLSAYESFFIGVVAASSSTAFVLKMLEQNEELSSKASNIMIGWLVMQDVLIIALFMLLKTYAPNATGGSSILEPLLKAVLLIVFTFFVGRFIVPKIFTKISETRSQELLLISVVALSVGFALITELLGISFTLGAFLTGLALSETFLKHEIFSEIKPLRDLFSMIFFVSIGTLFKIGTLLNNIPALLGILFLIISFKVIVIACVNLLFNVHPKNAIKVGLGLSQIGEFAFLAISFGQTNNWISETVYSLVLISTILTMTFTPFIYSYADDIYNFVQGKIRSKAPGIYRRFFLKHLSQDIKPEFMNHIIICGYGKVGKYIAEALKISKESFVVIEMDSNLVKIAESKEHAVIFGDATNIDILEQAGLKDAKAIIIALPESTTFNIQNFINEIKRINPEIEVILRSSSELPNINEISNLVEPEFEAAMRIVNKMEGLISENKYGLIRKLRNLRKKEINEVLNSRAEITSVIEDVNNLENIDQIS